jgi:hypothetical protein
VRPIVASILLLAAGIQAGCGEPPQNVQYENGRYAGKPDKPAWQGDAFGGSRSAWEDEIRKRGKMQSEYTRLKGGG